MAVVHCAASKPKEKPEVGVGLKSVWYGAEALGKLVGGTKPAAPAADAQPSTSGRLPREAALLALKQDYGVNYFISGKGELASYDPACLFADDFASFRGLERFRTNVRNLGGMLSEVQLDVTDWEERPDALRTTWRFSAILELPWRPRLAAAGATTHRFDGASGLVVEHIEEWDIDPGLVVRNLLKPSAKVPTGRWDVVMNAVYKGDPGEVWLALAPLLAAVGAGGAAASAAWAVASGSDIGTGTWVWAGLGAAAAATNAMQVVKGTIGSGL